MSEMFPSKYQRASELTGFVGTIERIEMETMNDGARKAVAYFKGKKPGFVLNKTRARVLTAMSRSGESQDWIGMEVEVYPGTTDLKGEQVATIKFKRPEGAKPPFNDDDNPF